MSIVRRRRTVSPASRVVIGTGLVALDVVIADTVKADPMLCAGGTCGNVLTALAYLGWDAYPIARLRSDAASKRIIEDLMSWGVKLDFVSLSDCGSTPVVVQHIRQNGNGERSHKFSRRCPVCGNWLPWYKAVLAATVPDLTPRLPKAHVFYFDRTSRGAVTLAQNARKAGALVVFEPSSESDPNLLSAALAAAHIVKVASDRMSGNERVLDASAPLLLVETLGAAGLRYSHGRAKKRTWKDLPAFEVAGLRDSAGAGDWCTAGIISVLGALGPEGLERASESDVQAALRRGQAMAGWTCHYDGARGGMYASTKKAFDQAIEDIVKGKLKHGDKGKAARRPRTASGAAWCNCCIAGT
jgi:sugar/nucleoside kinase (ribokinase family)